MLILALLCGIGSLLELGEVVRGVHLVILDEACAAVEDLLSAVGLCLIVRLLLCLLLQVLVRLEEHQVDRFKYFEIDVDHALLETLSLLEGDQVPARHTFLHGLEDFTGQRWEAVHCLRERHLEAVWVEQQGLISFMSLVTL